MPLCNRKCYRDINKYLYWKYTLKWLKTIFLGGGGKVSNIGHFYKMPQVGTKHCIDLNSVSIYSSYYYRDTVRCNTTKYHYLSWLWTKLIYLRSPNNNNNNNELYFEKTRPLSAESFTGYISIPIWIKIMTKLDIFQIEGSSRRENLKYAFKLWTNTLLSRIRYFFKLFKTFLNRCCFL